MNRATADITRARAREKRELAKQLRSIGWALSLEADRVKVLQFADEEDEEAAALEQEALEPRATD